jgi:hypothetical protein
MNHPLVANQEAGQDEGYLEAGSLVQNPTTIKDIPVEIKMMIFEELISQNDKISAVCLGLASSKLYSVLKIFFPHPISLGLFPISYLTCKDGCTLADRIQDFFGPSYRRSRLTCYKFRPAFLKRSVYGNEYGIKERELEERYLHYNNASNFLTRPFNMGEDWYIEVRDRFEKYGHSTWPNYLSTHYVLQRQYEKMMRSIRAASPEQQ